MVTTVKVSQFPFGGDTQSGDIITGLRAGVNTNFNAPTGGGGGAVTATINQDTSGLSLGNWVRVNTTPLYVPAQADSPMDAEVLGAVIQIVSPTQFVLQQSGYLTGADVIFSPTVLSPGSAYFLSPTTAGLMLNIDSTVNGSVSRAVFVPDSATSGWVLPYRGLVVGGTGSSSGGGGGSLTWSTIAVGGTYNMTTNNGYVITAATLVTMNMPASFALGDEIIIYNYGIGGYTIAVGSGQSIQFGNILSSIGSPGSISSAMIGDSLTMRGIIPNTVLGVTSASGNQTEV